MNTDDTTIPEEQPKKPAVRKAPRRPSKPDAVLAAAIETARAGLLEVVPEVQLGEYIGAVPEEDRLVTHRFQANRPGYIGWHWYATVARVPRGKAATVCEVGLLPSENSILAPEWVPWSERIRPEDVAAEAAAEAAAEEAKEARTAGTSQNETTGSGEPAQQDNEHAEHAAREDAGLQQPAESQDAERDAAPKTAAMEDE